LISFKHLISALKPLTPLQKEIWEAEATIKQLQAQQAEMERQEYLKRKRDALSEEVRDRHGDRVGSRERLTFDGVEINKLFATEEEAFTYAKAASDNNYFEAEVRRINEMTYKTKCNAHCPSRIDAQAETIHKLREESRKKTEALIKAS